MTFLNLLLIALATWNVSSLLVREDGPFHMFSRIRHRVGVRISHDGILYADPPDSAMGGLFSCVWCMSRWVALVLIILFYFFPVPTAYICIVLSLSTVAILVDRWT